MIASNAFMRIQLSIAATIYYCFMHKNFTFVNLLKIIFLAFLVFLFCFLSRQKVERKESSKGPMSDSQAAMKIFNEKIHFHELISRSRERIFFRVKINWKWDFSPSHILWAVPLGNVFETHVRCWRFSVAFQSLVCG